MHDAARDGGGLEAAGWEGDGRVDSALEVNEGNARLVSKGNGGEQWRRLWRG
jgi:hypothetical protein